MRLAKNVALAVGLLLVAAPAAAAEPHLALIRVESLDGLLADVQRVAALAGREMSREQLLASVSGTLGGADLSWVDGGKPWVAVVSMAALAQGPQALVLAIPARDEGAAVSALGNLLASATPDEEGVRTLTTGTGTPAAIVFRDGYLVASPARALALALRPLEVLARGDLPAGNLAVDVYLEAVAPMALAGLEAGRRRMEQRIAAPADEDTAEAPETEGEGMADDGAPAAPDLDSAALAAVMDLYLDLARDLIRNSSRLQMSIELASDHLLVHQRVLPLAGSTLAGLLAVQRGGLPALARLVDPGSGRFAVTAGQVTFTPASRTALQGFLGRYADAMGQLLDLEGAAASQAMAPWLRAAMHDRWPDCYRGDFAGTFDVDPESGFQSVQVVGARDPAVCQELLDGLAELAGTPPAPGGSEPVTAVGPEPLEYRGVRAMEYRVDFEEIVGDLEEAEVPPPAFLRGDFVSYTGLKDDLILSVAGPDSGDAFRRLVDRALADAPTGGIGAQEFAPLTTGPGFYAIVDLARLAPMLPVEADEGAAGLLAGLEGGARIVYGLHLGPAALHAQLALPLSVLGTAANVGISTRMEAPTAPD